MLVLAWLPLASFVVMRRKRWMLTDVIEGAGFTALALSSLLIVFSLAADVLFARFWLDPRAVTAVVLLVALAVVVLGALRARHPAIVRVKVPIVGLAPDLHGFRIVQLSDLHVSATVRRRFVERVVNATNGLHPHVIALTGDIADALPATVRDEVAPLARLRAEHGKFFVTGNHEYYWDAAGWLREVERLGFETLVNGHRLIERGDATLLMAGVTDYFAGGSHRSNPTAAVAGAPRTDVRVLLAHQPVSAYAAQPVGFDLQISGHTHGGQFFPFNLLIRFFQPFVSGLHKLEDMWLYVSRGTGYWGPPVRLGARPEITLIELCPAVA
jgi:predicted MPP superfamily phosphohydrolase